MRLNFIADKIAAALFFSAVTECAVLYFWHFVLFSALGWLYESFFCCMACRRSFENRGFLLGPVVPVYGVGATLCSVAFGGVDSFFALFLLSGLLCCVLEYAAGTLLESVFRQKFWDYSDWVFNIKGRTSLYCMIFFGLGAAIVVKYIDPVFFVLLSKIDKSILLFLGAMCFLYLVADFMCSSIARIYSDKKIARPYKAAQKKIDCVLAVTSKKALKIIPSDIAERAEKMQCGFNRINRALKSKEDEIVEWTKAK